MKSFEKRIKVIEEHYNNQPPEENRVCQIHPDASKYFKSEGEIKEFTEEERAEFYRRLEEKKQKEKAYYEKHGKPMKGSWAERIIRYRLNDPLFKILGTDEPGYEEAVKFCK